MAYHFIAVLTIMGCASLASSLTPTAEEKILYTAAVNKMLLVSLALQLTAASFYIQEKVMPSSNIIDDAENLWQTISSLADLLKLRDRASEIADSIESHELSQHIHGFKALIDEIENNTCSWVS